MRSVSSIVASVRNDKVIPYDEIKHALITLEESYLSNLEAIKGLINSIGNNPLTPPDKLERYLFQDEMNKRSSYEEGIVKKIIEEICLTDERGVPIDLFSIISVTPVYNLDNTMRYYLVYYKKDGVTPEETTSVTKITDVCKLQLLFDKGILSVKQKEVLKESIIFNIEVDEEAVLRYKKEKEKYGEVNPLLI